MANSYRVSLAIRPVGRRNRGAELFDEVIDDGAFRKILETTKSLACGGNIPLIIAILRARVPLQKASAQLIDLPKLTSPADAMAALGAIAEAAARGEIDAEHARVITATVAIWLEAYKATDLVERVLRIEAIQEGKF